MGFYRFWLLNGYIQMGILMDKGDQELIWIKVTVDRDCKIILPVSSEVAKLGLSLLAQDEPEIMPAGQLLAILNSIFRNKITNDLVY